jgi:hypothetical protein
MKLISAWTTLVLVTLAFGAQAGVEPSPFKSAVNKLDAVSNLLAAAEKQLEAALEYHPPDPGHPPDAGMVGKLGAVTKKMTVADGRVAAVLTALPSKPPPDDSILAALLAVGDDAEIIAEAAFDALHPPDPCRPPTDDNVPPDPCRPPLDDSIRAALERVLTAADILVDRIETYLDSSGSCTEICDQTYRECIGGLSETCDDEWNACLVECRRPE